MTIDKNTKIYLGQTEIVKIKKGDVVIWEKSSGPVVEPDYMYIENTYAGQNTVNIGGGVDSIQYSKDKSNWTTISATQSITLNEGEKLYFRGDSGATNGLHIQGSNSHIVGGNINTLLDYVDPNNATIYSSCFESMFSQDSGLISAGDLILPATNLAPYCYITMFSGCSSLTTAPALPATTLAESCYSYMFWNCSALTTAPALPATTLASNCYESMFNGCSALTTAPALPATTLASNCYGYMFQNCTSLTAPQTLPATTLASSCYQHMFQNCSALTTAQELPATTLATNCYWSMFEGCRALTTAPALPATTLASSCYRSMFYGCTRLTTAPALPATTLVSNCYQYMFYSCFPLNSVTVYANDNSATNCTKGWLNGVAATGTFYNYGSATYTQDDSSGIPTGWIEVKPTA